MLTTGTSAMVVNQLTGKINLQLADGAEVVLSDKVSSSEKVEIMLERIG